MMEKIAGEARRPLERQRQLWRDVLLVSTMALAIRIVFALLVSDTYDYDEFVILLLARDFAHGAVPYNDFAFFHPPGALLVFRFLEPLTVLWWPTARVFTLLIDSVTSGLVVLIAIRLYDRRAAVASGLIYAVSPLAVLSAVRVGQDPLVTFLIVAGVAALVSSKSKGAAALAGACISLAIWVKYPAAVFLPAYIFLAARRSLAFLGGAALTLAACIAPFSPEQHNLLYDTVTFQHNRWTMQWDQRLVTIVLYWLAVNALALPSILRRRAPVWLLLAFLSGATFCFTPQVYYHYFVPVVPFAAIIAGATVVGSLAYNWTRVLGVAISGTILLISALLLNVGGSSPFYVTAAHFSDIRSTIAVLDRSTTPGESVLADRFEYSYLARRPAAAHYFWNVGILLNAVDLERRSRNVSAVVLSHGASSGFPPGFTAYLDRRYMAVHTRSTVVWLPHTRHMAARSR